MKVIVIGGGVGGLTCAHELAERGFEVDVYEARDAWGGKARSQPVAGTGTAGRRDLPGEHGFRFYPRFYRHVIDNMKRTPVAGAPGRTVDEHLRSTTESAIALVDQDTWYKFYRKKIDKPYDVLSAIELFFQELDFDGPDVALFAARVLQFLTSCEERRLGEYDRISWWDFLDGDGFSAKFQRQLRAVPRTMVAMDPRRGSARTIGRISMQLILDYASSGVTNDRTMGGPTSQMWIDHWIAHLRDLGVRFHAGATCTGLEVSASRISGARFGGTLQTADHYVLAVPIDVAHGLISPAIGALDPALARLAAADVDQLLSWMVGIQFFLYEDVPLVAGHTFYPDSPWALTSISQPQFWRDLGLFRKQYGDGDVGGVISVDVSDWSTPGNFVKKAARDCTPDEIKTEIWEQLKAALNGATRKVLDDELLHSWHLDADLDYSAGLPPQNKNRLLVHPPTAWELRPEAASAIGNLCFAADYVRTNTDLASMEGACEAGRRAANAILDRAGSGAARASVWTLEEPATFDRWKRIDAERYKRGAPHLFDWIGIRRAYDAAALWRRIKVLTGIEAADDFLDQYRLTKFIDRAIELIGIPR